MVQPNDPVVQPNDPVVQSNDPVVQPNDPVVQAEKAVVHLRKGVLQASHALRMQICMSHPFPNPPGPGQSLQGTASGLMNHPG